MLLKRLANQKDVDIIFEELTDLVLENNDPYIVNPKTSAAHSYASPDLSATWELANKLKPQIEIHANRKLKTTRTFTRIYKEDSLLHCHVDRDTLDVTVSLCLKKDVDWNLFVSKKVVDYSLGPCDGSEGFIPYYEEKCVGFDANVGDGIFCLGRLYPHWRKPYEGTGNQSNIYSFLHYQIA